LFFSAILEEDYESEDAAEGTSESPEPTEAPGVNFINVLCTSFMRVEPKSAKKTAKS